VPAVLKILADSSRPQLAWIVASNAARPIDAHELASDFASVRTTDAEQWASMVDTLDMSDVASRRRMFSSLHACGCSKCLGPAGHVFTFVDGSSVHVDRHGITVL